MEKKGGACSRAAKLRASSRRKASGIEAEGFFLRRGEDFLEGEGLRAGSGGFGEEVGNGVATLFGGCSLWIMRGWSCMVFTNRFFFMTTVVG